MLYILFGEDDFSLREALREIKKAIGAEGLLAANTTELSERASLDELMRAGETVPFLTDKRLVIVRGLLARFDRKTGSQGKSGGTDSRSDSRHFIEYLGRVPETTVVVLMDGKVDAGNPVLKALSGKAEVREFRPLTGEKLRDWVYKHVAKAGGSISPRAADSLVKLIGSDLWTMSNEIAKLTLFAPGRRIEEDDLKSLVSSAQEAGIFAMVDAVLDHKPAAAQKSLHNLLEGGAAPSYILVMLTRQVRMMVLSRELRRQGRSEPEIQARLGMRDFALRRTLEQAGKYSWERLRNIYEKLLDTDLAIKTGRYSPELALNILVGELCQQPSVI